MAHPISQILAQSEKDHWEYPRLFDELKKKGVASYDVDVALCKRTFNGNFGAHEEPVPANFQKFTIHGTFDAEAVKRALQRRQNKETTYLGFLHDIANAGVERYRVDMQERKIAYR